MPCQATWTTVSIVSLLTLTKRGWVAGCGQPAVGRDSSHPSGPTTMSRAGTTGSVNRRAGASLTFISLQRCCSTRRISFLSSVSWCLNAGSVGPRGNVTPGFVAVWDAIQHQWNDNVIAHVWFGNNAIRLPMSIHYLIIPFNSRQWLVRLLLYRPTRHRWSFRSSIGLQQWTFAKIRLSTHCFPAFHNFLKYGSESSTGTKVKEHKSCLWIKRYTGAKVPWSESSWNIRSWGAKVR